MSDLQVAMNRVVHGFVSQIAELARQAALDTLESAFNGKARGGAASASAGIPLAALGPRVVRPRVGRGAKRTAADLDALSDQFLAFVKSNPGLRVEQINKELGTTTKDLALPIRKLVAEGAITAKGKKRSTTYSPGKKAKK
jgi:hypothetical protein